MTLQCKDSSKTLRSTRDYKRPLITPVPGWNEVWLRLLKQVNATTSSSEEVCLPVLRLRSAQAGS
ncbi:MAG: hypothetical protein Q9215_002547 [Flavoplaca cf. flavocitrina]